MTMPDGMRGLLDCIDAETAALFMDHSGFCEALLLLVVREYHRAAFAADKGLRVERSIEVGSLFAGGGSDGATLKPEFTVASGASWGVAGEAVSSSESQGAREYSPSHASIKNLLKGTTAGSPRRKVAGPTIFLAQKVMCQLFPAALSLRRKGIDPRNIHAYFGFPRNHGGDPLLALDALYSRGLISALGESLLPEAYPFAVHRIMFPDWDGTIRILGGNPADYAPSPPPHSADTE